MARSAIRFRSWIENRPGSLMSSGISERPNTMQSLGTTCVLTTWPCSMNINNRMLLGGHSLRGGLRVLLVPVLPENVVTFVLVLDYEVADFRFNFVGGEGLKPAQKLMEREANHCVVFVY